MIERRLALALALFTCAAPFVASADGPRQIGWPELMPKDWDAAKAMNSVDISNLQDDDPRANALLVKMGHSVGQRHTAREPRRHDDGRERLPHQRRSAEPGHGVEVIYCLPISVKRRVTR
jgi:hypothetical protein